MSQPAQRCDLLTPDEGATLRAQVREYLDRTGRTARALAHDLGTIDANLSRFLSGRANLSRTTAARWRQTLGLVGSTPVVVACPHEGCVHCALDEARRRAEVAEARIHTLRTALVATPVLP